MTSWKIIKSPQDHPKPFEVVLISDDKTVGFGYRLVRPEHPKGFRQDGWVVLWPPEYEERIPRILKWTELPTP
jgi:hypothetical protein